MRAFSALSDDTLYRLQRGLKRNLIDDDVETADDSEVIPYLNSILAGNVEAVDTSADFAAYIDGILDGTTTTTDSDFANYINNILTA